MEGMVILAGCIILKITVGLCRSGIQVICTDGWRTKISNFTHHNKVIDLVKPPSRLPRFKQQLSLFLSKSRVVTVPFGLLVV